MQQNITVSTTCPIIAVRLQDDIVRLLKGYEKSFDDKHLKRGASLALASMTTTSSLRDA